jgi:hypothetical protein
MRTHGHDHPLEKRHSLIHNRRLAHFSLNLLKSLGMSLVKLVVVPLQFIDFKELTEIDEPRVTTNISASDSDNSVTFRGL